MNVTTTQIVVGPAEDGPRVHVTLRHRQWRIDPDMHLSVYDDDNQRVELPVFPAGEQEQAVEFARALCRVIMDAVDARALVEQVIRAALLDIIPPTRPIEEHADV